MSQPIRKLLAATFTKADAPRTYNVTLSTGSVDREQDRIPPQGWVIPRRVPLLWSHDPKALPIGRVWDVRVDGNTLRGRIEFPPEGVYDFADTVVRLIETGFLASVSVGFRPIDRPVPNDLGGFDFVGEKELFELSVVNVPANVDARIDRMDQAAMAKWLRAEDNEPVLELLDDDDLIEVSDDLYRQAMARARMNPARLAGLTGPPVFEVDERELRAVLAAVVGGAMRSVISDAVTRELNRIRGRVD